MANHVIQPLGVNFLCSCLTVLDLPLRISEICFTNLFDFKHKLAISPQNEIDPLIQDPWIKNAV